MGYYYYTTQNETLGPVEISELYGAFHAGGMSAATPVAVEGASEWSNLAQVLHYFYACGPQTFGPVPLAEIPRLTQAAALPPVVLEPGGTHWKPLSSLLPGVAAHPLGAGVPIPIHGVRVGSKVGTSERLQGTPMPWGTRTAGIIWIVFGSLILLQVLTNMVLVSGGGLEGMVLVLLLLRGAFGFVFLTVGITTVKGDANDTLGNGIGSIGIAVILIGVLSFVSEPESLMSLIGSAIIACLLFLAGVFALIHRREFLAWKHGPYSRIR
jgi:hypothetical protein